MKLGFALLAGLCLCFQPLPAETIVHPGDVFGEWTLEGTPYIVTGNITVPSGLELHVEAGVTVAFTSYWQLYCMGRVTAIGDPVDSVFFTSISEDTTTFWSGIVLTYSGNPPNEFQYVVIDHATEEFNGWGAVQLTGGVANFSHCTLRDNHTIGMHVTSGGVLRGEDLDMHHNGDWTGCGGALRADGADIVLRNCRIVENNPVIDGTGLCTYRSTIRLENCDISRNYTPYWGGGAYIGADTRLNAVNCRFTENDAQRGGALDIQGPDSVVVERCFFVGNRANRETHSGTGGAIRVYGSSTESVIFTHCDFVGNVGAVSSAIHFNEPASVDHCIFAFNDGPVFSFADSGAAIHHSLVYDTEGDSLFTGNFAPDGFLTMARRNANGDSCDRAENLVLDPLLRDIEAEDFRLTSESPCIDAGDADAPRETDRTIADIGVYPYNQTPIVVPEVTPVHLIWRPAVPNPFNPSTTLRFELREADFVTLKIYDLTGREVVTLVDAPLARGNHEFTWDASRFSSGVYFAMLEYDGLQSAQKLLLLK